MPDIPSEWRAMQGPGNQGRFAVLQARAEADLEQRRKNMRQSFALPPLRDLKTVQASIGEVANAIIENRIDEDYAGELLQKLERASIALRPTSASR